VYEYRDQMLGATILGRSLAGLPVAIESERFAGQFAGHKVYYLEIGLNVVDWIGLAPDRYRWRALVNSVMNLRVP
jgi:hypothetical protein